MRGRTDIDALSITDGKISNQAKISPKKIAPATEASFMIAQTDKKYQSKVIHGDGTIDADGKLTVSVATATTATGSFTADDRDKLDSIETGATGKPTAEEVKNLYESNVGVVQRFLSVDSTIDGELKTTTVTDGTKTEQVLPNKVIRYVESTAGYVSDPMPKKEFTVTHNLGFEPQVTVLADTTVNKNGADTDFAEIDCEVKSTSTSTTIKLTEYGQRLKIICGG